MDQNWVIKSKRPLFYLNWKELWNYRDLLGLLVRRDLVTFYKQTIFGPLWFFIQPVLTTIVFTFVFGKLAGISTQGVPQPLFFLAGITAWNYFADCLTKTSTVFRDNVSLYSKVYFPRIILPVSITISGLMRFLVQLLLLTGLMIYYSLGETGVQPNLISLLLPVLLLMMAMLGLGAGLIINSLTTRYRDLAFVISFGVQLLMYATTVAYPLAEVDQAYRRIIAANPMTGIIETFRAGLFGSAPFDPLLLAYSFIFSFIVLVIGLFLFNRAEKTFIDSI